MNSYYSKIRGASNLDSLAFLVQSLNEELSTYGVNILTRYLDVLQEKLQQIQKGMDKQKLQKSRSRELLETNHSSLKE